MADSEGSKVWIKIALVVACILAGGRNINNKSDKEENVSGSNSGINYNKNNKSSNDFEGTCGQPCSTLQREVGFIHVIMPLCIACVILTLIYLPTLFIRCRTQIAGIKSFVYVLVLIWLHLVISYLWFTSDRVQGYVWSIHAAGQILAVWNPGKGLLIMQRILLPLARLGAIGVALFAWQSGPPVGLVPWQAGGLDHCGWATQLQATLGVDVVGWILHFIAKMFF